MAQFEFWMTTDLKRGSSQVQVLNGQTFTQDNLGNRVGVIVLDGGEPATLNGTVTGYVIRADGGTVVVVGAMDGNKAYIDLPESAYAVPGQIQIAIRLISGETKTVLGALNAYVQRTATGTIIDPGHVIPSLDELLAQIDAMEQGTAAANQAADDANAATADASAAASSARTQASSAHAAAAGANQAANQATSAASTANTAATNANNKATLANTAAAAANTAAEDADDAAEAATDAAASANAAAQNANNATGYIAVTEATSTASAAHAKGSYLIYDGKLYQATADIAIGDTLATTGTGANIAQVTDGAMGEVTDLKSALVGDGNLANISENIQKHIDTMESNVFTNILTGCQIKRDWYIDPSTGTGSENSSFFAYLNVPVPEDTDILYPYTDSNSDHYFRCIVFYDANGDRTGDPIAGNVSTVSNGVSVYPGTVKCDVCIGYTSGKIGYHYFSKIKGNPLHIDDDAVEGIAELKQTDNEIWTFLKEEHSDILHGISPIPYRTVNKDTGAIAFGANKTYAFVPIPDDVTVLFPYDSEKGGGNYFTKYAFYDAQKVYISGANGAAYNVTVGISVPQTPTKAKYISVSATLSNSNTCYLSYFKGGDFVAREIQNDVTVKSLNIKEDSFFAPVQLPDRRACFAFIFDDGNDTDALLKTLFDSYGFKCGFALIGSSARIEASKRYLEYQKEGFEILSHSINGTAFSTLNNTTAETYLRQSLENLTANGFEIHGFVTPSSILKEEQLPLVGKYYQYGFGQVNTYETENSHPFYGTDIRQLRRWNLETNTKADTLALIDSAIENTEYVIFYAHEYPQDNNFTAENMTDILTYLKTKSDAGDVIVGTPHETVNFFYSFRHSDLLELVSRMSN